MKKLTAILCIVLAFAICLSGCSKKPEENPSPSSQVEGTADVTITILQYRAEIAEALTEAITAYREAAPHVSIELETVDSSDEFTAILKARMQSESMPTIFNIGGPSDIALYESYLEDLSGEAWVAHASEGALDAAMSGEKVYGLPYGIEGYGFIYNKEIFAAANIDIQSLNTYEAIAAAFYKLQEAIDAGSLKEQYPNLEAVCELPGAEAWILGDHAVSVALAPEFNYDTATAYASSRPQWSYADAYKSIIDLQLKYSPWRDNHPGVLAVTYADSVQGGLALERVACVAQGNWIYKDVVAIDREVADKLDIMPLPIKDAKEDSIFTLVPMYWCVNAQADDQEKQAAKDFLSWLYQSDAGKELVVNDFGLIPAFDNYETAPGDALAQAVLRFVEEGKTINAPLKGYPDGWSTNSVGPKIQEYLYGDLAWEDVLSQAAADWERIRTATADGEDEGLEESDEDDSAVDGSLAPNAADDGHVGDDAQQ